MGQEKQTAAERITVPLYAEHRKAIELIRTKVTKRGQRLSDAEVVRQAIIVAKEQLVGPF